MISAVCCQTYPKTVNLSQLINGLKEIRDTPVGNLELCACKSQIRCMQRYLSHVGDNGDGLMDNRIGRLIFNIIIFDMQKDAMTICYQICSLLISEAGFPI